MECTAYVFGTVEAQILVPMFCRVEAAETYDKLLYFWRANAGYVIFNVNIGGDLKEEKISVSPVDDVQ